MRRCFLVSHDVTDLSSFKELSTSAKLLFMVLCKILNNEENAKRTTGQFRCANSYLSVASGMCQRTIVNAKLKLKQAKFIDYEDGLITKYTLIGWKDLVKDYTVINERKPIIKEEKITMI